MARAAAADPRVKIVSLSRNFGHQPALTAGLEHARGDVIVMIDGDLQDPPEVIPEMVARWRDGIDVVYAVRQQRLGETAFKRITARGFYRTFRRLTGLDLAVESGDFRLMDRKALNALLAMPERNRFLRGMTVWIGFSQIAVPFVRQERHAGVTKYPLRKMLRFSFDAITSFSQPAAAVGDVSRLLLQPRRLPGDPADDHRPLREHLRARRPDHDHRRPAAGRDPADHARDHRRVRRAHLRRGQAPPAVRSRQAHQHRGARRAMRIAVLGAGVAGLVAALRLTEAGHTVDVYERWPGLGGQAATLDVGQGHLLERYYHHLFSTDRHIAALYDELGMEDELEWISSSVAYFADGKQWPFVTPMDLLRFKPLPPLARVRLGAAVLAIQRGPGNPAPFERITARKWIERYMGRDAYRTLWGPLLRGKFGERADDIAMVWLQNKFRLRRGDDAAEEKLGYPKHSWELLFNALRTRIEAGGGRVLIDRPAAKLEPGFVDHPGRARLLPQGPRPARLRDARARALRGRPGHRAQRRLRAAAAPGLRARGLPGQAARDRVLHRAVPADRARPPVLAVLLDQHRRRRAAVRRPDRAHEPDRARSATAAAASSTSPTTSRAGTNCSISTPKRCSSATHPD